MLQSLMQFPEGEVVLLGLLIMRLGSFIVSMPVIGAENVPAPVKVGLAMVMSVIMFPLARMHVQGPLAMNEMLIALVVRETMVGLLLGMIVRFAFYAVAMAGELIGTTSGIGAAQLFNPTLGTSSSVFEQFQSVIATLLFFGLNGHHYFIEGVLRSTEILPLGRLSFNVQVLKSLADGAGQIIFMGLQIAAPVLVSVFLAHIAMGVLGRAVPQINVLMTSIQVTLLLTIFVMIISLPTAIENMGSLVGMMSHQFDVAMAGL
jgi:flagellar biosynthesis protein FliR